MRRPRTPALLLAAASALLVASPVGVPSAAAAPDRPVTLESRALLPATEYQPGPPSGAATTPANGVSPPYPGQPVPGFSAVLPYRGADTSGTRLWAMPDNGFGTRANSADFLLRVYDVSLDPRTASGRSGTGAITVNGFSSLRDPDHLVPFPIVNEGTADRLLTGADFDIESMQRDLRGDFWIGDEFGPYLLHVDSTGRLLEPPIGLPDGTRSPQAYDLGGATPTLGASNGFEALAAAQNGRYLHPVLEGARTTDDPRRRVVYEFDTRTSSYTGRTWSIQVAAAGLLVGDAQVLGGRQLLFIERDNTQGATAQVKRLVVADLDRPDAAGYATRRTVADLLTIADPAGVSLPARPGETGVGPRFSFPLVSVESVLPLRGDQVLVANDNNFPGNDGRIPGRPDDTEVVVLRVPGLRG
ncbi:esterase-like activity of phytase family protein [Modestobacter sp. Leaf380]|uniref:esterase-like activity of phytase family protein n=1 Tax=Modestobacter sp. Leaf380 TaxID=1736356 RepID=UPI00070022ED|nr:esterase-like activity of phytase family protein [Modestobacter sp. Leaf380]KQS68876.1 hypothetical protein ASG41_08205 [Modestobacter sp. Leaf380]